MAEPGINPGMKFFSVAFVGGRTWIFSAYFVSAATIEWLSDAGLERAWLSLSLSPFSFSSFVFFSLAFGIAEGWRFELMALHHNAGAAPRSIDSQAYSLYSGEMRVVGFD